MENSPLFFSITAFIVSLLALFFSYRKAKYARGSVTSNIILKLEEDYSTPEMNKAVHYLMDLKKDHKEEIAKNKYAFARKYLKDIKRNSEEWEMRRKVSHFYGRAATLIHNNLIDQEIFFSMWGEDELEIIEFLEPIETIIAEQDYGLPYNSEWSALRLFKRLKNWQMMYPKTIQPAFTLPNDRNLYNQSKPKKKLDPPIKKSKTKGFLFNFYFCSFKVSVGKIIKGKSEKNGNAGKP